MSIVGTTWASTMGTTWGALGRRRGDDDDNATTRRHDHDDDTKTTRRRDDDATTTRRRRGDDYSSSSRDEATTHGATSARVAGASQLHHRWAAQVRGTRCRTGDTTTRRARCVRGPVHDTARHHPQPSLMGLTAALGLSWVRTTLSRDLADGATRRRHDRRSGPSQSLQHAPPSQSLQAAKCPLTAAQIPTSLAASLTCLTASWKGWVRIAVWADR